jgi:outer membrane protein assembly factor BamB
MSAPNCYFYKVNGDDRGPASQEEILDLIADREIGPDTLVSPGLSNVWLPLRDAPEFAPALAKQQTATKRGRLIRMSARILGLLILGGTGYFLVIRLVPYSPPAIQARSKPDPIPEPSQTPSKPDSIPVPSQAQPKPDPIPVPSQAQPKPDSIPVPSTSALVLKPPANLKAGNGLEITPHLRLALELPNSEAMQAPVTPPAVAPDGTIYVGTTLPRVSGGQLFALRTAPEKGSFTTNWILPTPGGIRSAPAVGEDGTVFIGCDDGKYYAVTPQGKVKWEFTSKSPIHAAPALGTDGTVYLGLGTNDHRFVALDSQGTLKWSYATRAGFDSSAAIDRQGIIYVGCVDSNVYALNPDGKLRWSLATSNQIHSSPAIGQDGTVYIGSDDRHLYAIDPSGQIKWAYEAKKEVKGSPIIGLDGTVYVISLDRKLHAVRADGTGLWQVTDWPCLDGAPLLGADGILYHGSLIAADWTGAIRWNESPTTGRKSPGITPNAIVLVSGGILCGYKGPFALADSPWPMGGQNPRRTARAGTAWTNATRNASASLNPPTATATAPAKPSAPSIPGNIPSSNPPPSVPMKPMTSDIRALFDQLEVKGITGTKQQRLALINNTMLAAGESVQIRLGKQTMTLRCEEIKEQSVVVSFVGFYGTRELPVPK